MPTYEYQCQTCQHVMSEFKPMRERNTIPPCDNCYGYDVKRLFSAPVIIFNGPGFPGNDAKVKAWASAKWKVKADSGGGFMDSVTVSDG